MTQRTFLVSLLCMLLVASTGHLAFAQNTGGGQAPGSDVSTEKTPWLKGVNMAPVPEHPSPILPVQILQADGHPFPATMTEDVAVLFSINTDIFADKAPTAINGQAIANPEWTGQAVVNWFFNDTSKNTSTIASSTETLPPNQMKVTPIDPTNTGAVTVFCSRGMKYVDSTGKTINVYANGSVSAPSRVLDITPPMCGLAVTAGGKKGSIWTVENPPNKFPLPKMGDVCVSGELWSAEGTASDKVIAGLALNGKTKVSPEQLAIYLPKAGEVQVELALQDNDKINDTTVKYGLCELKGDVPRVLGNVSTPTIDPSKLDLPAKDVYLFVEAADMSGNKGALYIPVVFK